MSEGDSDSSASRSQHTGKKLTWSPEEDALLLRVLEAASSRNLMHGDLALRGSWSEVAAHLPGRSAKQARERWRFNLCPGIHRGAWALEEDAVLLQQQLVLGNQWALIARRLPGRTENSVKIRFKSLCRAARRVWTPEDDAQLLVLHEKMGSRWADICAIVPNRTRNGVKTRCLMLRNGVQERPPQSGAPEQLFKSDTYAELARRFAERSGLRGSGSSDSEGVTTSAAANKKRGREEKSALAQLATAASKSPSATDDVKRPRVSRAPADRELSSAGSNSTGSPLAVVSLQQSMLQQLSPSLASLLLPSASPNLAIKHQQQQEQPRQLVPPPSTFRAADMIM